ncbi:hypothetical protein [Breoghania sp.]|uniref:hypothetical protein n=1 Tax=Breoghania sp. TaxID=2065378 RepID=UPI0029C9D827|nr:hypothetical protein [Breoghania sp.]
MISYLVDAALMVALVITSVKIVAMYRELKRLGSYHADYQRIFDQTTLALDGIEVSIQEINVRGSQVLNALGSRMDDARGIIADIDALTREARKQQAALRTEMRQLQAERENPAEVKGLRPLKERMANRRAMKHAAENDPVHGEAARIHAGQGNSLAVDPSALISSGANEMRIQRIDDKTYAGSFRSVSVGDKDNAK